jgi:hypothetical protein
LSMIPTSGYRLSEKIMREDAGSPVRVVV